MPGLLLDTSAFAKLYIEEDGSAEVRGFVGEADPLVVSAIVLPEALSALRRLVREGKLGEGDYSLLKERICRDVADIEVVPISEQAIGKAVAVIERHPIRTLDALHIGAALAAGVPLLVTADSRQAEAARGSGLEVRFVG